ncbi:DUF3325 domain-containing protein [Shewanella marisflavi]|uniref:DUF3325 domain-containing protein n=1 Tax=Shewanella marisflavi TaxID=260364 RepID=UPI003AAEB609
MIAALSLTFTAFGALALAMFTHFKSCFNKAPSCKQQRIFTLLGWGLLALSFSLLIQEYDIAYASITFFGVMSGAALTVILLLSYQAKALPTAMITATVIALGNLVI